MSARAARAGLRRAAYAPGAKLCFDDRRLSRVMSCSPSASARHGAAEANFCGAIFVKVSRGICIEPFLGPRTCCFHEVSYATVTVEQTRRQVPRESSEERTSVACSVLFIDDGPFKHLGDLSQSLPGLRQGTGVPPDPGSDLATSYLPRR